MKKIKIVRQAYSGGIWFPIHVIIACFADCICMKMLQNQDYIHLCISFMPIYRTARNKNDL